MDTGYALCCGTRSKQASPKDMTATCHWLSFAGEGEIWGSEECLPGGVKISLRPALSLTLRSCQREWLFFSIAIVLCNTVVMFRCYHKHHSCYTWTIHSYQRGFSTQICKQSQMGPFPDLWQASARPAYRVLGLAAARGQASGSPWPVNKASPQPLRSDKRGQGPRGAAWLFVDALHGLKPMRVLSAHPDKTACDEFHSKSRNEEQCEQGLEDQIK